MFCSSIFEVSLERLLVNERRKTVQTLKVVGYDLIEDLSTADGFDPETHASLDVRAGKVFWRLDDELWSDAFLGRLLELRARTPPLGSVECASEAERAA
jgi:hypothetical protein